MSKEGFIDSRKIPPSAAPYGNYPEVGSASISFQR